MQEAGGALRASGVVPVHVLLPASILSNSPSFQDGVPADTERDHRFFGCELIQEAGVLLRLPQVVMVTAQTMLHRFYYRKSLRDFDAFRVAFACVFLAAKVEERPKRIKDVLSVFYALYRRRKCGKAIAKQQLLDLESGTYCMWRDWLVMVERQILIDLGFSVYNVMEHPHKYILYYIKIIGGSKELAQMAWGYINDSLRIDLCTRYNAEVIACAAIFLASRFLQVKLPDDPPWYALFDVEKRALHDVSIEIMGLYKRGRVQWLEPLTEVNPFADDDDDGGCESVPEGDHERAREEQVSEKAITLEEASSKGSESGVELNGPASTLVPAEPGRELAQVDTVDKREETVREKTAERETNPVQSRDDGDRAQDRDGRGKRFRRSPSRDRDDRRARDRSVDRRVRRRRSRSRTRSRSSDRRRKRRSRSDSRGRSGRRHRS